MNSKAKRFYIDVMNCDYTRKQCPQAWKSFSLGVVPRAFNPGKSREVKILVVAKNPGHPLKGEKAYYRCKTGENLLKAKKQFELKTHKEIQALIEGKPSLLDKDKLSLKYHFNLRRYLRYFLGLSHELETYEEYQKNYSYDDDNHIFKDAALTELFKCSTKIEDERITNDSFQICYDKFFTEEIRLFRPKVILALGKEVSGFLQRQDLTIPLVSIKHPSYFFKKADELRILRAKKKEIENALKLQPCRPVN